MSVTFQNEGHTVYDAAHGECRNGRCFLFTFLHVTVCMSVFKFGTCAKRLRHVECRVYVSRGF